jgi:signal transduction histidine kinase
VNRPLNIALGWRIPSWLLDFGPVALIVLEGAAAIRLRPTGGVSSLLLALALAGSAAALLFRHRTPLGALTVVLAIALALNYGPVVMLPTLLAAFTVAEYSDRVQVAIAAAACAIVVAVAPAVHGDLQTFPQILSRLVAIGLAVAVGLYLRARADYIIGLQERAERLERERELLAQQAIADERLRIARELHDVIAHNVSLMVVQAQALTRRPPRTPSHRTRWAGSPASVARRCRRCTGCSACFASRTAPRRTASRSRAFATSSG